MTSSHSSPHNSIPVVSEAKMEISTLNDEFSRRNNRVERASRDRGNFEASFSPFGMYKFRISCAHKFYANSILLFFSSKLHCDLLPCSSLCARCVALCDVRAFRQFTQFTFPTVLCVFLFSVIFCAGWCLNRLSQLVLHCRRRRRAHPFCSDDGKEGTHTAEKNSESEREEWNRINKIKLIAPTSDILCSSRFVFIKLTRSDYVVFRFNPVEHSKVERRRR